MRTAILPVLALFMGLGFGSASSSAQQQQDQTPPQTTPQTTPKKEDPPTKTSDQTKTTDQTKPADESKPADAAKPTGAAKPTDGVADPVGMVGGKPEKPKPVLIGGAPVEKTYTIGAEDVIQVWVLEQAGVSGAYVVRPDGIISIPEVGDVQVSGLTTNQVSDAIADKLKANQILNDPSVTVGIAASHSRKYYIYGEVNRPGPFDLVVPTRVSEALANAAGFKDFAKKNKIRIIREVPGGKPMTFMYNEKEVSHGKNLKQNIYLEPGDRIYVD